MTSIPTVAQIIANSDALKAAWAQRPPRRTWIDSEIERRKYMAAKRAAYNKLYYETRRSPFKMCWFENRADGSV